ncbi:MAG TPA: 6-pyruvoyl-tetrahydropterin synthase-related protein [Pyrinomonadaceae bacterium]|nr:6-pyruvoyl-tetrahydropterin synthase-related protein [Pyrinomonadaceae bacterium]
MENLPKPFRHLILIAVFALCAMLPIYWWGLPSGNDQSQHYQFAWTVHNSLREGMVYPGFAAATNHGFGDYGLRFYPPATYYVLAIGRILTGDWYTSTLIALTLVFFIGALGTYLWTRELFGPTEALIAAALYTVIPYHLNEVYNNFLLAEFFTTAVLPFCFLFLHRLMRRSLIMDVLGLAVSYSLLVLTHLPLTIIGTIAMAIHAVFLLQRKNAARILAKFAFAGILSAAMTAFYWSRMLPELAWITHSSERYFSTTWDYRTNFLLLPSHWVPFGEDVLNLWFADLMLVVAVLVFIPTVFYLRRVSGDLKKTVLTLLGVLAISVLLTTPLTKLLWDNVGLVQKVQFPWRWLAIVSLFAAGAGAWAIARASKEMKDNVRPVPAIATALAVALLAFMAVVIVKTPVYVSHQQLNAEIATFDDSTGCDCWWPIWARNEALGQKEQVAVNDRRVEVHEWSPYRRRFAIASGPAAAATIKTFYYPRWQATISGASASVRPDDNGAMTVDIPTSTVDVTLSFVEPTYVRVAAVVSLLTWIAMFLTAVILLLKSRGRTSQTL